MLNKKILVTSIIIFILILVSLGIGLATSLGVLESFRIIFGSIFVLFIPGFIISFIFFPKTKKFESENSNNDIQGEKGSIDIIERIALSFALSIAVVPLVVFYLNLIGVKINMLNSFLAILGIVAVSFVILSLKIRRFRDLTFNKEIRRIFTTLH